MDGLYQTNDKKYILEIYINQLEVAIDKKTLVKFVWKSEDDSYTSLNVLLHAGLYRHLVDQKLTLKHTFRSDASTISYLKLYDVTDDSKENLMGECEIDLRKLLNISNPVKFKLMREKGDPIPTHTYVTTTLMKAPKSTKSALSSRPSFSERKSEDMFMGRSMLGNTGTSFHDPLSKSYDEGEIYNRISKMSYKLSNIEKDILRKTYKLNQLNKENVSEMTKIKTKLEKDLMKKDLQIKILINQLDELHTSLALSHQRELELSDRVQFQNAHQNSFADNYLVNHDVNSHNFKRDRYRSPVKMDHFDNSSAGYNKTYIDELETNFTDLQRFKQDYERLNDPGTKINKCKEIINNLEKIRKLPRHVDRSSTSSSNYQNNAISAMKIMSNDPRVSLKPERLNGTEDRFMKKSEVLAKDREPVINTKLLVPMNELPGYDNKLLNGRLGDLKSLNKRMPAERTTSMLQVPILVESKEKSNKIYGGGVFIPNMIRIPSGSDKKSTADSDKFVKHNNFETSSHDTINGLERELVDTKIKLADSETKKEVYYSLLRPHPPTIIA